MQLMLGQACAAGQQNSWPPTAPGASRRAQIASKSGPIREAAGTVCRRPFRPFQTRGEATDPADAHPLSTIQAEHGLEVTGQFNAPTIAAIQARHEHYDQTMQIPLATLNDSSQFIADAQQMLANGGFYSGEVNGVYLEDTAVAIGNYQRERGLPVTGVFDGHTALDLETYHTELQTDVLNQRFDAIGQDFLTFEQRPAEPTSPVLLEPGARGQRVRDVQVMLESIGYSTGGVDGVYGSNTANAVRAFQEDVFARGRGIVDVDTYESLSGTYELQQRFNRPAAEQPDFSGLTVPDAFGPILDPDGVLGLNVGQPRETSEPDRPEPLTRQEKLSRIATLRQAIHDYRNELESGSERNAAGRVLDFLTNRVWNRTQMPLDWLAQLETGLRDGRVSDIEFQDKIGFIDSYLRDFQNERSGRNEVVATGAENTARSFMHLATSAADTQWPFSSILVNEANQLALSVSSAAQGVPHENGSLLYHAWQSEFGAEPPTQADTDAVRSTFSSSVVGAFGNYAGGALFPNNSGNFAQDAIASFNGSVISSGVGFSVNVSNVLSDPDLTWSEKADQLRDLGVSATETITLDTLLGITTLFAKEKPEFADTDVTTGVERDPFTGQRLNPDRDEFGAIIPEDWTPPSYDVIPTDPEEIPFTPNFIPLEFLRQPDRSSDDANKSSSSRSSGSFVGPLPAPSNAKPDAAAASDSPLANSGIFGSSGVSAARSPAPSDTLTDVDAFPSGGADERVSGSAVRPWQNRPPQRGDFPITPYPLAAADAGSAAAFEFRDTVEGGTFMFRAQDVEHYRAPGGGTGVRFVDAVSWFPGRTGPGVQGPQPLPSGASLRDGYLGVMQHLRDQGWDEVQFVESTGRDGPRVYDLGD